MLYTFNLYTCIVFLLFKHILLQTFSPRESLIKGDYVGLFTTEVTHIKTKRITSKRITSKQGSNNHSLEENLHGIHSQVFHETTYYYKKFIWKNLPHQCFRKQV